MKWRTTAAALTGVEIHGIGTASDYVSGFTVSGHNFEYGSTVDLTLMTPVKEALTVSNATHAATTATVTFSAAHGMVAGAWTMVYLTGLGGAVELNDKIWYCTVTGTNTVDITLASMTTYTTGGTGDSGTASFYELVNPHPPHYGLGEGPLGLGGLGGYDLEAPKSDSFSIWFDDILIKHYRLDFDDSGNLDNYLEAGRIFMGFAYSPTYNMDWGAGINYYSDTKLTRTRNGSLVSDNRPSYRTVDFSLDHLSQSQFLTLLNLVETTGKRSDAVLAMYPEGSNLTKEKTTMLGRFTNWSQLSHGQTGRSISFTFQEAL